MNRYLNRTETEKYLKRRVMSVNYKLLKNYSTSAKNAEYRAVIIENQKIGLRRIADDIEGTMSLTSADIVGVVAGLRNAKVRTVKFRPDKEMMEALRYIEFVNTTYKHGTSEVPTKEEIDEAVETLLAEKPFFTVEDLRHQLNLSHTYAYRVTAQLAKAGKLRNIGTGRTKLYVRCEKRGRVIKNRSSGKTVYNSDLSCIFWVTKHNYEYWENEE